MAEMTIYTLAKELNMSPSMVSRAFNPDGKINKEKRMTVLEAAKKYNFSPNKLASRLSMKSIKIGVLINSRFKVNKDKMIAGINCAYERLKDYKVGYDITVLTSLENGLSDYEKVLKKYAGYDGIVVSGLSSSRYTELLNETYKLNPNIVQVQAINEGTPYLFASKHNEVTASELAVEFLYNCLKKSERKNILLFVGSFESSLHMSAKDAFVKSCEEFGMNVVDCVETKDNNEYLREILPEVFEKHKGNIDGIYTTSGISNALCEYIENNNIDVSFVSFDTHKEVREYLKKGVITATIDQNVTNQMASAFEALAKHIINGDECEKVIYTDIQLVMKSNIYQFE